MVYAAWLAANVDELRWAAAHETLVKRPVNIIIAMLMIVGMVFTGKGVWIGGKAIVSQVLLKRAWVQTIETGVPASLWASMDARPIAKIGFPAQGNSAVVLEGSSGQALAFGPAHMAQTPLPGQAGLSVIAAHKNTHFSILKNLKPGEKITVQLSSGQILTYEMTKFEIVDYQNSAIPMTTSINGANTDEPSRLALVTCYPFDKISFGGPLRYVVYARLV